MENNNQNQEANQYFYPYDKPDNSEYKAKIQQYGTKFQYYAVRVWPYVQNIIQFFLFHIKRTIGGIITMGKDQLRH